jgi:hypothetical protein
MAIVFDVDENVFADKRGGFPHAKTSIQDPLFSAAI